MTIRSRGLSTVLWLAVVLVLGPSEGARAEPAPYPGIGPKIGDWFSENFEVHGFLRTRYYTRVPDWQNAPVPSSLRSEINLEPELRIFSDAKWNISFYGVLRPVYEAAFDHDPDMYGRSPTKAAFGTGDQFGFPGTDRFGNLGVDPTIPNNITATQSGQGKDLFNPNRGISNDQQGGQIRGEATYVNADTGTLFTGDLAPALSIDDVVFYGRVTAPTAARGRVQGRIGGNADGTTYEDLRDNFPLPNAGLPEGTGLDASLNLAGTDGGLGAPDGLDTPLNFYSRGGIGDRNSLVDSPFDINRKEYPLKFECGDNANPTCWAREFYIDVEYEDTFIRFGRQQIVWGKTDAFRLQDVINPIDFSYHNVFPDLEERRIPVLALDVIHSFGNVGPLEDVSLEFAWVWDRFIPDQFGQCGEPWAFTAACEARADAGGHQLFNFSLAGVDKIGWKFTNTQPGIRLEFRTPDPSIAFSISAFYGWQKLPVAEFDNYYSVRNPNPAAMLFLQGLADPSFANAGNPTGAVAVAIEQLAQISGVGGGGGTTVWSNGFDPYAKLPGGAPVNSLAAANDVLQAAWNTQINVLPSAAGGCADVTEEDALEICIGNNAILAIPWTASEAELRYPRVLSLGGSMDYQIPGIDTVLRVELAADIRRGIQDTEQLDGWTKREVFKAAVGIDRSTFIPFLNPNRTAFISFQTFVEYIVDYNKGSTPNSGMVPYETNVISTLFMQNFWRNDSIVVTNLAAVDWQAEAIIWGPSFRYVYNQNLFFEFGFSMLWGQSRRHNIRNICRNGFLNNTPSSGGCTVRAPGTWNRGQWTLLNGPAQQASEAPFGWAQQSFADKFMRRRDEFWVGVTYQF